MGVVLKYISSEIKNTKGISLLFEKAVIKKTDTPLILAVLAVGDGEPEKQILRDMGAWFQNEAVGDLVDVISKSSKDEQNSAIEENFDSACLLLQEKWRNNKLSIIFCIDDNVFISGDNAYTIQNQFGRLVTVPAAGFENETIKLAEGATLLLTEEGMNICSDSDCIECLVSADTEDSLSRVVREISTAHPSSLICVKNSR